MQIYLFFKILLSFPANFDAYEKKKFETVEISVKI